MGLRRRTLLAGAALLPACTRAPAAIDGGFVGQDMARGHALRDALAHADAHPPWAAPAAASPRTRVVIAGGGIAALAAARALRQAGVEDFVLMEQQDAPGGNSRAGQVHGLPCPLGAHYLPVPGDEAPEVQALLEELGLRQRVAGRWRYDERHLCHSPQERLFFDGHWQEGLLPVEGVGAATLAQYRRFATRVAALAGSARFAMPALRGWADGDAAHAPLQALDAEPFATWLQREGLHDAHLRWYLDYCCRDDFGAGTQQVSAWAGIHYFASRHGFHAPGEGAEGERDGVLTWPEGNGWLVQRLAAPLGERLRCGQGVLRIAPQRRGVLVDAIDHASGAVTRWQAAHCIVALPLYIAARVVQPAPDWLAATAARLVWAPWVVSNIHLRAPLQDRPGAAPAWDNVLYQDGAPGGLGYVDAGHQRLSPWPAPTVLSYYQALGDVPGARALLAQAPWQHWRDAALHSLSQAHPDLPAQATRIEVARWGHAMAVPTPGLQAHLRAIARHSPAAATRSAHGTPALLPAAGPLSFAHSDWAGYSVFEEAFTRGHLAGLYAASL